VFANQIYLYGLRETFELDTDHKSLVPLFASHKATAPLRIEWMSVRLQLNYMAGKKANAEASEADYNRTPRAAQDVRHQGRQPDRVDC